MYDTVNIYYPVVNSKGFDLNRAMQNVSDITEHKKPDGQSYYSGHLGNYKVNLSEQFISLKGSLAKYFLPDNFHTLTRADSQRAIEKLSDETGLQIGNAKVNRIDFSVNLLMRFAPELYYNYLGESNHFKRLPQSNSLYYTNGLRQKLFYNKIAEGRAKKNILPDVWQGQNVLRYEMRLTSRLTKQLNEIEITASSLSDEIFYMKLFDKWFAEYQSINKLNNINFNSTDMNTPKDFFKQLSLFAIEMIGHDKIMQEIENLKAQKTFDKPEYYCRLKSQIRDLCKTPKLTASSDLVAELDKKIKNTKENYR